MCVGPIEDLRDGIFIHAEQARRAGAPVIVVIWDGRQNHRWTLPQARAEHRRVGMFLARIPTQRGKRAS